MRASAARAQVLIVTGSGSALQVAASVGSHIGVGCPLACSSACACGADAVQVPALALALCGASSAGPFLRGRFFEAEAFFLSYRLVLAPAARFFSSPNSGARCCPVYEPGVAKTLGECAMDDQLTARGASARTEIDNMIGAFDHVQMMLDDDHSIVGIEQVLEHGEQFFYVFEVQTGGGFIEHVHGVPRGALGELSRQLDSLGLPSGERGRRLPQVQIVEIGFFEQLQSGGDLGV